MKKVLYYLVILVMFTVNFVALVDCGDSPVAINEGTGPNTTLDPDLVGKWADGSFTYEFKGDGTFIKNGNLSGKWSIQADRITFEYIGNSDMKWQTGYYNILNTYLVIVVVDVHNSDVWHDRKSYEKQ